MHHFRGKLLQGAESRLDPANVYIQYRTTEGDQGQGWYGYLLVASETDVEPGGTYTLMLMDGRSGQLRIETVSPDESGNLRATFFGEGSLGSTTPGRDVFRPERPLHWGRASVEVGPETRSSPQDAEET